MTQYAVVWRPDLTHEARALGPYRSAEKATEVLEDMLVLEDRLNLVAGFEEDPFSWLPQVVRLEDWRLVERELVEQYSEPTESVHSAHAARHGHPGEPCRDRSACYPGDRSTEPDQQDRSQ